jgi:hypothetical protein
MPNSIEGEHWTVLQRRAYLEGVGAVVDGLQFAVNDLAAALLEAGEITSREFNYATDSRFSMSVPAVDHEDEKRLLTMLRAIKDRLEKRVQEESEL